MVFTFGTVVSVVSSIYLQDRNYFLFWLAILGLFLVFCFIFGLVLTMFFAPVFWILGKLTSRRVDKSTNHTHADKDLLNGH